APTPPPTPRRAPLHRPGPVARHAARISAGVLLTYGLSVWLDLSFSYWATMATVMVMQPATEATWPRTLERILGSVGGGLLAAALLALIPGKLALFLLVIPLAALTIGLKSVNYTLFVLFLTPLFVLVISLFQPQEGIPIARALNNVLGALIGLMATALLWPEPQTSQFERQLAEAAHANLTFASLVLDATAPAAAIEAARRNAGLKSSLAETALRRKRLEGQSKRAKLDATETLLSQLRLIAGAATVEHVSPHPANPERARHYASLANLYAAHLAANRTYPLPPPEPEPDDDLGHAVSTLTAQLHA
ncbi:FUSC family protein, partial [Acidocella sp.]|uniref:FUSC family protein n=1 Tax=Acidocella sp. TaxID=50710 RepID=UPI0026228B6D